MKFIVDSMLPPSAAALLVGMGHDAVTPHDLGAHNLPDSALVGIAANEHRVIVTENAADFAAADCAVLLVRKRWWPARGLAQRLATSIDQFARLHPSPGAFAVWLDEDLR